MNEVFLKDKFTKRLRQLFDDEKISKRKFSKISGVNTRSITEYLEGLFFPRYDTLIKLANYFEVSIDYLLGISDNNSVACDKGCLIDDVPEVFRRTLKEILNSKGMTEYRLSKLLDIGQGKITMWLKYGAMPETPMLAKIATALDCSVDYLLGRDR